LYALFVHQGLSKKAIARELGCSDTTVAAAVRHFGLTRSPSPKVSDEERQLIIDLYSVDRQSARVIARRTTASRDEILQTLRTAGVPLRGRGARTAELLDSEQLRQRYEAGASLRELAQANQTDDGVIRYILTGAGVPIRHRGPISRWQNVLTDEFLRQKYFEEQLSLAQIAQQVGCAYQTVLDAAHRHGVPLRRSRRRPVPPD
jgi:transposase